MWMDLHVGRKYGILQIVRVLTTILVAAMLAEGTFSPAKAEPGKNRIEAETTSCSNGQNYEFVLNGMGKAWQVEEGNANLVVKRFSLTYFDPTSGEPLGSDTYGEGNKNGLEGSLIACEGETTTELRGIGLVRVVAEFEALVTPRRGA